MILFSLNVWKSSTVCGVLMCCTIHLPHLDICVGKREEVVSDLLHGDRMTKVIIWVRPPPLAPGAPLSHHIGVHSVLALVVFRLPVWLSWSDVGVQRFVLVDMQVDAGVVQLLILISIQFRGWRWHAFSQRTGLDLSGQTEEQLKVSQRSNPFPGPVERRPPLSGDAGTSADGLTWAWVCSRSPHVLCLMTDLFFFLGVRAANENGSIGLQNVSIATQRWHFNWKQN